MSDGSPLSTGRALVLHPVTKAKRGAGRSPEARLEEAVGLARAIDLEVVHGEVIGVARPRPATLIGSGTVAAVGETVAGLAVEVVVVDGALTPVQQRNLERAWNAKVIDRTGLILEIFGARARTKEGQMQVELAALTYQRSRLVRSWTHLERQRGALGFVGGPGESQLEIDRRLIGDRIAKLRRQLGRVRRTRGLHRRARRRVPYPVVALVGYTNAGKSTLFNRFTAARVLVRDILFATLDPTMRALALPTAGQAILSDTVGFVSDLPTELVAAFRATLEEVLAADLIVHVRDVSHPDSEAQREDVDTVLAELGVDVTDAAAPLQALNKIDLLDPDGRARLAGLARRNEDVVPVSARTGAGCEALLARIAARLQGGRGVVELDVPLSAGAELAWLYRKGEVLDRRDNERTAHLRVRLAPA
ncbi:MAG: GTPase HflX, partial [Alphaproteobacteria bacterium]